MEVSSKVFKTLLGRRKSQTAITMGKSIWRRPLSVLAPATLLIMWQILVMIGILDNRFFPAPTDIFKQGYEDFVSGQLASDLAISLIRLFIGFIAGAVPGIVIGLSMGLFKPVRYVLDPIVASTYPIPKLALMPLIMLMFGLGEIEKYVVIMLGVFFPVLISTVTGVLQLDEKYMDVARDFGASRKLYYTTVALPGSLPMIFTGLKLGLGMALLFIMTAEMEGATGGIGYRIWISYSLFQIKDMYVGFIAMALIGYFSNLLLDELEARIVPWKG
ncbi:ABC transporter permease [Aneurinibacillus sp. Ricciae_BoGa-3]|uniref:ABC transporter permease n=1 Tax=Aneurinibacillus sp. Ricciae_BoGa-3 TaxID=3022697 RepID=UPI0023419902|nr:ABC transporter permease [Aneurinibacillus sp. Ricciae_BoGa-3]WCK53554.1 ABC transporter permease [Aneurinibacillus sp. Ricciae_BoGa-3]